MATTSQADPFELPPVVSLVLLGCLALPIAFVAFGLGAIRLAGAETPPVTAEDVSLGGNCLGVQAMAEHAECRADAAGPVAQDAAAAVADVHAARSRSVHLRQELRRARGIAEALRQEIEAAKGVDVTRVYGRFSRNGVPQWVVCGADGVTLQPQNQRLSLQQLEAEPATFVDAAKERGHAVFLIRPDGYAAFESARGLVEPLGLAVGYEPVDADWKLRF